MARKKEREAEIHNLKAEIYQLKKQEQAQTQISNDDRIENLEDFFNSILSCTDKAERNSLYKTIIESITWLREGDNIEMKINFL